MVEEDYLAVISPKHRVGGVDELDSINHTLVVANDYAILTAVYAADGPPFAGQKGVLLKKSR